MAGRPANLLPATLPAGVKVTFILPLFNRLDLTQTCVESLRATLPAGLAYEIILLDDDSTDGTRPWLASLRSPFRVLLNERNLGFAATNNRGAAAATGDILALINSDLVLQPHWLEPMLALLLAPPRVGVVGNLQFNARTGALDHAGLAVDGQCKLVHDRPARWQLAWRTSRPVPAVTAACALVPAALFRQLGGFDEAFRNGGEDVDLCFRARAAGFQIRVALRSRVLHHISASPGRKRHDEANSRRLVAKWSDELLRLGTRRWCREYLEANWADPRDFERPLVLHALYYLVLQPARVPAAIRAAQRASLGVELARWERLLGPLPAAPAPSLL